MIQGIEIPIADVYALIPLKAKAWMNLIKDKSEGKEVNSRDIKKHKNDVFRLSQILIVKSLINLSDSIRETMKYFIENVIITDTDLTNLNISNTTVDEIKEMLSSIYL